MNKYKYLLSIIITIILLTSFSSCYAAQPYIIEYSWGTHSSPAEAVAHRAFIDTLPFDGMMMRNSVSRNLMNSNFSVGSRTGRAGIPDGVWTYSQCMADFSPLTAAHPNSYYFSNVKHNFPLVWFHINNGLFNDADWNNWILPSYKNFAKACKDLGFEGIVIDNEIYSDSTPAYFDYSSSSPYYIGKTQQQCHMQSRLRGKQVMEAILSEFPGAAVMVLHGPYASSAASNSPIKHCYGIYCVDWRLQGSFAAGIIEGSGLQTSSPRSIGIDGGELYDLRTLAAFKDNYEWRRYGIVGTSVSPTVQFVDNALRSIWSDSTSISYGLYDMERATESSSWYPITDMNTVRNTVANALRVADDYVWHYTEGFDWFADPANPEGQVPATQGWKDAIALGKLDAAIDTVAPSIAITSPTTNPTYPSTQGTVNLAGTATDNYYVKSVDWSINGGGSGNCTLGANGTWSVNSVPLVSGINHLTVTVTDKIGNSAIDTLDIMYYSISVTINQTAAQLDPTRTSSISFNVSFNTSVSGFTSSDIVLTGTALPAVVVVTDSGDHINYSVTVSGMSQSGTIIASIPAGAASDTSGNLSGASTSTDNTVTYDITSPTVTINQDAAQLDPATTSPILFKAVFSEPVTGFTSSDIVLSGTAQASSVVVTDSGDHKNYSVSVSGFTQTGTVVATIPAGSAQDLVENLSAASSSTDNSITYNGIIAPTVTINQDTSQLDPATTSPIVFKVVFSKPISGFLNSDIILSGSAGATTAVLTSSGDYMNYSVAVSGMTQSGTVIASIPALAVWDKVNSANKSVASTSTDNVVMYSDSVSVSGSIDLQSFYADKSGVSGTVDIRDSASGEVVESHPITLDASGNYSFTTSRTGDYTLAAKCSHWLSDAKNVSIALSGNVVNFSLINGDCNNDNAVDEGDFGMLSNAWYSSVGDPNFNVRADLNADGAIDEGDFGILSNAWYQSGN